MSEEMSDSQEVSVRDATIYTLEFSQEQFGSMKKHFQTASDLFDEGKDQEGLGIIADELVPSINALYTFSASLLLEFDDVIGKDLFSELNAKAENLLDIMENLSAETEKGNFTEIGDILRFDMHDVVNEFAILFPKIVDSFKNSKREDLDEL